jgi:carboxyl-terminal processing protease
MGFRKIDVRQLSRPGTGLRPPWPWPACWPVVEAAAGAEAAAACRSACAAGHAAARRRRRRHRGLVHGGRPVRRAAQRRQPRHRRAYPDTPARSTTRKAGCAAGSTKPTSGTAKCRPRSRQPTTRRRSPGSTCSRRRPPPPSGRAKDRFHFTYDTEVYRQLSNAGVSAGYGIEFASCAVPRRATSASPWSSPARRRQAANAARREDAQGRRRRRRQRTSRPTSNVINRALSPRAIGESHTFVFSDTTAAGDRHLKAANVTSTPVQNVKVHPPHRQRRLPAVQRPHLDLREAARRCGEQLKGRHQGPGARHALQRRRPAEHCERTGLHGGRAGDRQDLRALAFNDKNPFRSRLAQTFCRSTAPGVASPCRRASRCPRSAFARHRAHRPRHLLGERIGHQRPARRRRHGQPRRRHHLRQALRLLSAGQLRHHLLRDPVQGREPGGLRRLRRRLRAHLHRGRRLRPPAGRQAEARLAAALGLRSGGACPPVSSKAAAASVGLDKAGPAAADAEPEQPYLRDRSPLRENRLIEAAPNPA